MKTMTCRQMAGPCDVQIHGNTSEEMMNNGAAHLQEMAATGEEGHVKALEMMEAARTNPALAKEWGDKFEADFAALSDE